MREITSDSGIKMMLVHDSINRTIEYATNKISPKLKIKLDFRLLLFTIHNLRITA